MRYSHGESLFIDLQVNHYLFQIHLVFFIIHKYKSALSYCIKVTLFMYGVAAASPRDPVKLWWGLQLYLGSPLLLDTPLKRSKLYFENIIFETCHLRNKFHFSEVHRSMNATGPVQSYRASH